RLDKAFLGRIGVKVKDDFVTKAFALLKFGVEVAGVLHLGIHAVGVGDAKVVAITLKVGGNGLTGEIVRDNRVAGQNAGPGGLRKRRVEFNQARSGDRARLGKLL